MRDYRHEIDDTTYNDWFLLQYTHNINKGMFVDDAKRAAKEFMYLQFRRRSEAMQCESQKDYYDNLQDEWTPR